MNLREEVSAADRHRIRDLAAATGFFHADEILVAQELVDERLFKGNASGYHFLLAEEQDHIDGYICYGPIPCTAASYDLYWIVVHPQHQGQGLGRFLLHAAEEQIRSAGGRRIYADTSERPQYRTTRSFYERCGYHLAALLPHFYDQEDGKVIYCKVLT